MIDRDFGPIPGQKIVDLAHGMAVCHAIEDVSEVGERLYDACVSFARFRGTAVSCAASKYLPREQDTKRETAPNSDWANCRRLAI